MSLGRIINPNTILSMPKQQVSTNGAATLDMLKKMAASDETKYIQYAEINRICALPLVDSMTPEEQEAFNRMYVQAEAYEEGFRLFPSQVELVSAYQQIGGTFGPVGVGFGKCVCADTEVVTEEYGRVTVKDVATGLPFTTLTVDEHSLRTHKATAFAFKSGQKRCVRLLLESCHQAGLSIDHPVFTARGWVWAGSLTLNDFVACRHDKKMSLSEDLDWRRVESITPVGMQDVYDLSVPGTHTWIGNGIVLHNTLATLMIANEAYAKGLTKMMLLVPVQVLGQLVEVDIGWARQKVGIRYPIHVLGGKSMVYRRHLAGSKKKGLYILPFSLCSTKDTRELLTGISPEIIIIDEAHNLANRSSARSRRLIDYIEKFHPEVVALSGTITNKSIIEYHHLMKFSLRDHSPLPNSSAMAHEWAAMLDAGATSGEPRTGSAGPLLPLVRWAQRNFPETAIQEDLAGFRKAYSLRAKHCMGYVSSGDASIGTSLVLHNEPVKHKELSPGWEALEELIRKVNELWLTPNDDEIEHAIHTWKWLIELTAGFYNSLSWPAPEVYAERKSISEGEAQDIIERAKAHHEKNQDYARLLRDWLERFAKPHLDTPFLVGMDMLRNKDKNVTHDLYAAWKKWKDADFEGRPDRDSHVVRVCPYKIEAATRWVIDAVPKGVGCIVWYYHQGIGAWLTERLREFDLPVVHCPAGEAGNAAIRSPENGNKVIVASISAHGEGKNLQHFQWQYFVQWPRPAKKAEQVLGRTHRSGQKADELVVWQNLTTEFDQMLFAACLNDSLYIHQTTGPRQKLIYASYDPLPKIFPPEVLRERGLETVILTADQRKKLSEKFGKGN